jgi:hypothetical protein
MKTGFWNGVLYGLMLRHASSGVAPSGSGCGQRNLPGMEIIAPPLV